MKIIIALLMILLLPLTFFDCALSQSTTGLQHEELKSQGEQAAKGYIDDLLNTAENSYKRGNLLSSENKWEDAAKSFDETISYYEEAFKADPSLGSSNSGDSMLLEKTLDINKKIDEAKAGKALALDHLKGTETLTEKEVIFPDPNLEAMIRDAINKPEGAIYAADLVELKSLEAPGKGIKDITGLEYSTNLQTLDLFFNQITDVSPLSGLTNIGNNYW